MSVTASAGVTEGSRWTKLFSLERSTHMQIRSVLFLGTTTIGEPVSWLCYGCNDTLGNEKVELLFEFIPICKRDSAWCTHTEWAGIIGQGDVEFLARHGAYLTVKYGWELGH